MGWGLWGRVVQGVGIVLILSIMSTIGSAGPLAGPSSGDIEHGVIEVTLNTVDGIAIAGNYYIGEHTDLIIVLNGLLQNKDSASKQYFCRRLAEYYDVLNIDFRGRGRNGGDFTEGVKEVFDLQAAINFGKAQGYSRIAVVGFSFGGYLAIKGSALSGGINCIVTIGAPYGIQKENAAEPEQKQKGIYKIGEMVIRTLFGSRSPEETCEESSMLEPYLTGLCVPLLIMHGNQDTLVPYANANSILKAATEPKTFYILDGYNHAESYEYTQLDSILRRVIPWLETSLH